MTIWYDVKRFISISRSLPSAGAGGGDGYTSMETVCDLLPSNINHQMFNPGRNLTAKCESTYTNISQGILSHRYAPRAKRGVAVWEHSQATN